MSLRKGWRCILTHAWNWSYWSFFLRISQIKRAMKEVEAVCHEGLVGKSRAQGGQISNQTLTVKDSFEDIRARAQAAMDKIAEILEMAPIRTWPWTKMKDPMHSNESMWHVVGGNMEGKERINEIWAFDYSRASFNSSKRQ